MSTPSDNLTFTPMGVAQITIQDDIPQDPLRRSILLEPLAPEGFVAAKAIRWLGAGAGVLWFAPVVPRKAITGTEQTKQADGLTFYRSDFSGTWEEQQIGVVAIHEDSTAGIWKVTF